MTHADFPHAQTLLDHAAFVRALARGLVRDESSADDLAQDTWLRAARSAAPRALDDAKNWLATIVRNRSIEVGRSQTRRSSRERAAARPEALEAVEVSVARLDAQRDVVSKILALDEPYRSVVILRYYHELSHEQIAQRLGAKPATVRTQLTRAHEQLRAKLDKQYGGRTAWAGLLLPAVPRGDGASVAKFAALAATAAVLGVVLYFALRPSTTPDGVLALAAPQPAPIVESPLSAASSDASPQERRETSVTPAPTRVAQDEELFEPAELFDRARFGDYEKATFSFEHGMRDDAFGVVRNDWDLLFERESFRVRTVVDDQSLIVDLGERSIESIASAPLAELEPLVAAAAQAPDSRREGYGADLAQVRLRHSYFVWTRDRDTDRVSAFEVVEFVPGSHVLLEWYSTLDGLRAKGSFHDLSRERSLMATLVELRDAARHPFELPPGPASIVLQLRNGSGGGNPVQLDFGGGGSRINERSSAPLDFRATINTHERARAHFEGGVVPRDAVFVATSARLRGQALGDSNGRAELRAVIGGEVVFESKNAPEWVDVPWSGRVEIRAGEEQDTHLIVRNSSQGELVLEGELLLEAREPAPQTRSAAPKARPREPRKSAGPRVIATLAPRLELIARGARRSELTPRRAPELDFEYEAGELRIREHRDDALLVVDLGEFTPQALVAATQRGASFGSLPTAARTRFAKLHDSNATRYAQAAVEVGHAYFALNLMPGEDLLPTLLFATAHEAGARAELDWFERRSAIGASGSLATEELTPSLSLAAGYLFDLARSGAELREPRAEFQFRAAASNGSTIDLIGQAGMYVAQVSGEPLDLVSAPLPGERSSVHAQAGLIPRGQRFVLTRIEYSAKPGATDAPQGFVSVSWRNREVLDINLRTADPSGAWTGELAVEPGEERELIVLASYVHSARVVLHGRFEPAQRR